ncbi:MAG: hypothetical protein WBQ53_06900 [Methylocystis sp.]
MSFFSTEGEGRWLGRAVVAIGLTLFSPPGFAEQAGLFSGLAGHWSGGGAITMSDGSTERIHCRATYAVAQTGAALNQTLSCASASYNLHITANVVSSGGGVSGSWSESTHSVSGSISGRANSSDIQAYVSGAGFSASIGIRTHGGAQSVTIRPQGGTDVRAMSITLRRG